MTNSPNTILLLESGDLEVYDGKRPDYFAFNANSSYDVRMNNWLSTKRIEKMADGEYSKLVRCLHERANLIRGYPIDVSDIVELLPNICSGFGECTCGHLGYFKEPVREVDSYSELIDLVVKNYGKSKGEVISIIQEHFTINRK